MTVQFSYNRTADGTETFVLFGPDGAIAPVTSQHANFDRIRGLLLPQVTGSEETIFMLANAAKTVEGKLRHLSERVTIEGDKLYFDGDEQESRLSKHIVAMVRNGDENWAGYVAFLENLKANPSSKSKKGLFRFLQKHELVITEDGCFIGYKGISGEGKSVNSGAEKVTVTLEDGTVETHTGRIPNPVGAVIEMPRSLVDPDRTTACSVGLHVGNHSYASGFGTDLLTVKVNPRDVVEVPDDSHGQKIRTCRYEVVENNEGKARYTGTSFGLSADPDPEGDSEDDYAWLEADDPEDE